MSPMKVVALLFALLTASLSSAQSLPKTNAAVANAVGKLPMAFEANQGQTADAVQFIARAPRFTALLKSDGAVFVMAPASSGSGSYPGQDAARPDQTGSRTGRQARTRTPTRTVEMKFAGADPRARAYGEEELSGRSNYFVGSDASQWRRAVPQYARVNYKAVYPGIDAVYYGTDRELEYDLVVAPHADPARVRLQFRGQDELAIDPNGDIDLHIARQELRLQKPVAYQLVGGCRREVIARFSLAQHGQIAIALGPYDHAEALILDPRLVYSSYLGGTADEGIFGIGFDLEGNIYMSGETSSIDFPTKHPAQSKVGASYNAFVSKFDRTGSRLIYSTYLGGSVYDHAVNIAVDKSGSAIVAGLTQSPDFPVVHALSLKLGGPTDAFVAKLSSSGSELLFSTYLGGTGDDQASDIAIDLHGDIFVTGFTNSLDFPVTAKSAQRVCDGGANPGSCIGDGLSPSSIPPAPSCCTRLTWGAAASISPTLWLWTMRAPPTW